MLFIATSLTKKYVKQLKKPCDACKSTSLRRRTSAFTVKALFARNTNLNFYRQIKCSVLLQQKYRGMIIIMELAQNLRRIKLGTFGRIMLSCYLITCVIGEDSPSVVMSSENNQTVREGESLTFYCNVTNPVSVGFFKWVHYRNATGNKSIYYPDQAGTSDPRITVNLTLVKEVTSSSSLFIRNSSSVDSGLISCHYWYNPVPGNGTETRHVNRSLCVASQPQSPPLCLESNTIERKLFCTASVVGMCPADIKLRWFDVDTKQELVGSVTRDSYNKIENILMPNSQITNYLCELESSVYPNVHLKCSIERPLDVIPTIETHSSTLSSNISTRSILSAMTTANSVNISRISTSSSTESTPEHKRSERVFTRTFVILAACAGGGGVFIITVFVIIVYIFWKRICKSNSDNNKFQHTNIKNRPEDVDEAIEAETTLNEHEISPYAKVSNPTGAGQTGMYSTLNEVDNPVLGIAQPSRDSNPFARVEDSKDGDIDQPKMELPRHGSVNEYAYAYAELRLHDPNPDTINGSSEERRAEGAVNRLHHFVLDKNEQNNEEDTSKPPTSPHEYAYASFDSDGKSAVFNGAKNETESDDDDGIMVENSIYVPSKD